jgi:hypothetical protein
MITNSNKDQKGAFLSIPLTQHCDYNCRYRPAFETKQAFRSLLYECNGYANAKVVILLEQHVQQTYIYQEYEMVEKYNRLGEG